jgi:hypothetical protein
MIRYTVRLPDGRLFHFLTDERADQFAAKHGGQRIPFSVDMLPMYIRGIASV